MSGESQASDLTPQGNAAILASDAEREQTVSRLSAACKEGRLPLEEYGDRVGQAYAARTRDDLALLVRDLPPPVTGAETAALPTVERSASLGQTQWHISPIGGLRRYGRWRIDREMISISLIGSMRLDLRQAEFASPEVTLTKISLIGGVRLAVPPGIRVEVTNFSLIGGRRIDVDERVSLDAPVLYVRAFCVIGSVRVQRTLRRERRRDRRRETYRELE